MSHPHTLKVVLIFILLAVFADSHLYAQTYNMANGTINTCSGTFYDPGGAAGNYANNSNITQTFCSNAGNCLTVNFTAFRTQGGNDLLTIYDGPTIASPIIGVFSGTTSPGSITASSGCLTFNFVSNASTVRSGWAATISCGACGTSYLMNNNTAVNTCGGLFFDGGGSAANYTNNQNFTKTFCSSTPGSCLQIQFTSFALRAGDNLTVYNGNSVASPLIGTYSGTTLPPTMLSSSGCLTVNFTSNANLVDAGWQAIITCEICPSTPAGSATYTHPTVGLQNTYVGNNMVNTCGGTYTDNGGIAGNYSNNIGTSSLFSDQGYYRTFCPNQAGKCLRAQFYSFGTELGIDYLAIRNGPTQGSTILGAWWGGPLTTYSACMGAGIGPYTSTDQSGCLTFEFFSDASVVSSGWVATFDCVPCANGPNGTDNSDCLIGSPVCTDQSFSDASTGPGIVSDGGNGCVLSENFSNWYKITVSTGGNLGLTIVPNVGTDDYDFAMYQSNSCGSLGAPVRCSYASNTGNTGMNNANNLATNTAICGLPNNGSDVSEDVCGNGWVNEMAVSAGQNFYLLVNKWSPGGSGFTLDWTLTGGASLNCSVLPVELISFQANAESKVVRLNWTTASEINNQYFTVERSADGTDFEPVQMVDGAGTTTVLKHYETIDEKPFQGISYYRLKQTDFDGKFSYSDKVPVDFSEKNDIFYLQPNPAGNEVSLIFSSCERTNYSLQILSTDGISCLKETVIANPGMNKTQIDISGLPKGVYIVILDDNQSHRVSRLVHH